MNPATSAPDYAARLRALRDEIKRQKLDGFLVPTADEFQSETLPPCAERINFLTGFTGSAGLAAVMTDKAVFFTDGRYTLQAGQQIPAGLFTIFDSAKKTPSEWLKETARTGQKIGFDPWLHTAEGIERTKKALKKTGAELVPAASNPVDAIWKDRPAPPAAPIYAYDTTYAGQSSSDKRQKLAEELRKEGQQAAVITDPASIAWLLNVRGGDVPYTPLPLSYALLRADATVEWFVDPRKMTSGLEVHLGPDVLRYGVSEFPLALKRLGEMRSNVRIDPAETPYSVAKALEDSGAAIERSENPCALPKACKNPIELEGLRAAHRRDGAALARFFAWLDENATEGKITELIAGEKLLACRAGAPLYRGPSFAAIAAAGPNGAIVHYRATAETNRLLEPGSLFLLDSGGQYLDGTTDVTRTVAIGTPTAEMRDRFTRVLKGHIALAAIVFPEGTTGAELEVLARQFLWPLGLDYGHSTGHGIGNYLGVHEGPQALSRRSTTPLKPGMALSNEPGYYKTNKYGIRIENIQAVIERPEITSAERKMFGFDPLTLVPIDKRLVVFDMLSAAERKWLNDYHLRVRQAVRPLVDNGTAKWLDEATAPLD
ncbi:MAG: aminopeptidase P family protein [Alphaproteobacteria bacterium]|nr:aminopeptidase P family protein [Alphaproteobacteria bacterium]